MATRTVPCSEEIETLKRIARFGTERVVAIKDNDDDTVTITTDRLDGGKLEIR